MYLWRLPKCSVTVTKPEVEVAKICGSRGKPVKVTKVFSCRRKRRWRRQLSVQLSPKWLPKFGAAGRKTC